MILQMSALFLLLIFQKFYKGALGLFWSSLFLGKLGVEAYQSQNGERWPEVGDFNSNFYSLISISLGVVLSISSR